MKPTYRSAAFSLLICLFLSTVVWAYLGELLTSRNPSLFAYYPPPNQPYPIQYIPILANMPAPTATPQPPATLHVGLNLRWDGQGHLYLDDHYWNPGTHETHNIDRQVDGDTVRISARYWYSPNPFGWQSENWYCHYNTSTNRPELCSFTSDPAWRWGYPWIIPSDWRLASGGTISIDGQGFTVTGPHSFVSGYGELTYFWRLVNNDRFLYHHSGSSM